jgi:hypothetical protein
MDIDFITLLSKYDIKVLHSVDQFIQKSFEVLIPIEHIETSEEMAQHILDMIRERTNLVKAVDCFIYLLGVYHFKLDEVCPVYNKIYYNDSIFGKYF